MASSFYGWFDWEDNTTSVNSLSVIREPRKAWGDYKPGDKVTRVMAKFSGVWNGVIVETGESKKDLENSMAVRQKKQADTCMDIEELPAPDAALKKRKETAEQFFLDIEWAKEESEKTYAVGTNVESDSDDVGKPESSESESESFNHDDDFVHKECSRETWCTDDETTEQFRLGVEWAKGAGVFRAYDPIKEVATSPEAGLLKPGLVRTSNMRKYMATMLQALNTTEAERQWVLDHLGHTVDVHRIHYRQTSDMIERVDVAMILLIQDMGLVSKYRRKRLEDIQLNDLFQELTPESGEGSAESSIDLESGQITNVAIPDDVDEYIPDMTDIEEEADEDGSEGDKRRPKKRVKPYERKRWRGRIERPI